MWEITKETSFSAAHFLREYNGACENLHGHNWKVFASLRCEQLDAEDLCFDFKELKTILRSVVDRFDHATVNDVEPFDRINPSSENIARFIAQELQSKLSAVDASGRVRVHSVVIYETPTSKATYFPQGAK